VSAAAATTVSIFVGIINPLLGLAAIIVFFFSFRALFRYRTRAILRQGLPPPHFQQFTQANLLVSITAITVACGTMDNSASNVGTTSEESEWRVLILETELWNSFSAGPHSCRLDVLLPANRFLT
jgi:hypothetical protein